VRDSAQRGFVGLVGNEVFAPPPVGTFLVNPEGMCLGVPGKIVEIEGLAATVDFFGVRRTVRLDVVDEPVSPGDYILNHVGFAIRRIPEEEIGETLALYEQLLREAESDIMAADVRGEIEAGREDTGVGG
jgi:hydrogenase expression/formation protein HypC